MDFASRVAALQPVVVSIVFKFFRNCSLRCLSEVVRFDLGVLGALVQVVDRL